MNIYSGNINLLEKALDYSTVKQKLIANNVANADTPNYKSKQVSFKDVFSNVAKSKIPTHVSDPRHIQFQAEKQKAKIYSNNNIQYHHNGNSVDIDKEMSDLATNQIYYHALVDRLNGKFSTLQSVIKGGR